MAANLDPFFFGIEDIPRKNSGGCLFFCYVFWLWLKDKNMPTESFAIHQYDYKNREATQRNLEWIDDAINSRNPTASYHFTWVYEGEEYDADGVFEHESLFDSVTPTELSGLNGLGGSLVDEFCMNALHYGEWNYSFDFEEATADVESFFDFEIPTL